MTSPETPPDLTDHPDARRPAGAERVDDPGRPHEREHEHRHLHVDGKTMIGATIAAVAIYEVAATTLNRALDEPLLPTSSELLGSLNLGAMYRVMTPPWLRTAALLGVGGVLGTLGVAGGVVGMTKLDTPEERHRTAEAVKRLAHKATDTVTTAATTPTASPSP